MAKQSAKPGTTPTEAKVHQVHGIQVYGRKGPDGKLSNVDAIDVDEGKILEIADRLGVTKQTVHRKYGRRIGRR